MSPIAKVYIFKTKKKTRKIYAFDLLNVKTACNIEIHNFGS